MTLGRVVAAIPVLISDRCAWREIVALYRLSVPATPERNLPARYNICPTDTIDTVVEEDGKRDLVPMRWGLVPWWWKKRAKDVPATFNARALSSTLPPDLRPWQIQTACTFQTLL
jgi:putative SOS response-associated peptidase YedK